MSAPCPNAVTQCEVPTSPLLGYNAEAASAPFFIGKAWGPNFPPPLGYSFENTGCFVTYHSTVSELDANANAYAESVQCAESQWFSPEGFEANDPLAPPWTQPEGLDVFYGEFVGGIDDPPLV